MEVYLEPGTRAFMRYFDFPGAEPGVVFLAGLGMAATAAFPRTAVEPGLSGRRRILVDLLGCGYSDRPPHFSYSIVDHAVTLVGLLSHIGSTGYALVGHSMGGAVAIELAAKRGDLVGQLILAEANLEPGGGLVSGHIGGQSETEFITAGHRQLLESRRRAALDGDPDAAVALGIWQVASPAALHKSATSLVQGAHPSWWEQLLRLSIPKTFIFGSRSLKAYREDRELHRKLRAHGIPTSVVPDAGHGMMVDNPAGFAEVIAQALRRDG